MNLLKLWLCVMFIMPLAPFANELVKETKSLDGVTITYNYTSGRSYNVKFESEGLSYQYLTGSKPDK